MATAEQNDAFRAFIKELIEKFATNVYENYTEHCNSSIS